MALAEKRGFCRRYFILLSLLVLMTFFHRLCEAQTDFDCVTLQPSIENAFMGPANNDYTVTVDQPYYQQGSIRRVTVNAGNLVFTHLFLQARKQDGSIVGGWTLPLPTGYQVSFECTTQSIIKVGTDTNKTITFEWIPPFADTSENVFFIATFVNTQVYFIIQSEAITDPCVPSPCSAGDVCFRGMSPPGYICTGACTALTCQNGGNCSVGTDGGAKCTCSEGLTGKTCESCDANYCQNRGQCIINSAGEAQCLCTMNYMGTRCQLPRDGTSCFSNPCSNGGTCNNEQDGSYSCTCTDSFFGDNCETPTFCSIQPCQNGGTCNSVGISGGSCTCAPGYTGGYCEVVDLCHNYCFNGATCIPPSSGPVASCQCASGFSGSRCQTTDDFCSLSLCRNGATCLTFPGGGGFCICPPDYTGSSCEMAIEGEFCRQRLCVNGATCLSLPGGTAGQCVCPAGYSGPYCEVDEGGATFCSQDPCQNGGSCWDLPMGGGQCHCPSEFTGSLCEFEQESDNCLPNFCQNGGTCISVSETASQCQCTELYTGPRCEIFQVPSFCSYNLCMNGAICMDTDTASGICLCPDGYRGSFCEELTGFCALNQCMNGATCEPIGQFGGSCHCVEGFTGVMCEIQGPCANNPCLNGGTCASDNTVPSGFTCRCLNLYVGTFCQNVNPCESNPPCQNQGTCLANSDGSYICQCSQIYVGDHCETLLPCLNNPCSNGGTCSNEGATYTCRCGPAFSGTNCEIENVCILSHPCLNGGSCTSTGHNSYDCQCLPDFIGQNCETHMNPCTANICQNGGTCMRTSLTEVSCTCPSHVLGARCDIPNPCNSSPCFHGSQCTPFSDGSGYTCTCPPRLTGPNCETPVNLCSDSPCVNGTCISDPNVPSNIRCICQDGFSGEYCEILDDYCQAFQPCLNGGTCTTGSNPPYSCECSSRYDGDNCKIDLSDKPVFSGCPGVTVSFPITSNSNLANITLNPRATVPETGEEIMFDVIVGPTIDFPSTVMYDDIYLEGQRFVLRATDSYGRENTCSFTVQLTDQVPPTIECPGDYRDISVANTVEVASLPLQPITRSDNIGLREASEFSPSEVSVDGRSRRITVSAYDLAGNKAECSFMLMISKQDETCSQISGDNGQVSCSLDGSGNRICRLSCNDGFAAVNGEYYTCRNAQWDKDPIPCAATKDPVSVTIIVSFVFPLSDSSCSGRVFLVDAAETMRNKLDELNLCRLNSASACEPDSIIARCPSTEGDSTRRRRRRRQNSGGEVEIDVEVSAVLGTGDSVSDIESDVSSLVESIEEAEERLVLTFGDETVQYSSRITSQDFIVACQRGSVPRNGSCITCPAGSSHDEQAGECNLCEPGNYQPEDGQTSCLACDPGTYQGGRGATQCDECSENISAGETSCPLVEPPPFDWVMIVIYVCVGVGAILVVVIFVLMVCLWQSTQEEKKQDQKRWEIGQGPLTQLNKSYEPEFEPGFRPRVNTTVSASTYQTVPEGDGTPNLGNGHTSALVPIPIDELYAGIMLDQYGNTLSVGVDTHPVPHPRDQRNHRSYEYDSHHENGFLSSGYDRRDFPI